MKQIKLNNETYKITDDTSDEELKLRVSDVWQFKKYKGYNLNDIFATIDLYPEMFKIDCNPILETIDFDYDISNEEFLEEELSDNSLSFLEEYLKVVNDTVFLDYCSENKVICGEDLMYTIVRFYAICDEDDREIDDKTIENIQNIKSIVKDKNSIELLEEIDIENTDEGIFYVMALSTYYE